MESDFVDLRIRKDSLHHLIPKSEQELPSSNKYQMKQKEEPKIDRPAENKYF
jgi:hypothetical protein